MKTFSQFINEGLLDDLVGEFDTDAKDNTPKVTRVIKPRKRFKPRIFKGTKRTKDNLFVKYIRSTSELKSLLNGKITLAGIIDLYANKHLAVADNVTVELSVDEIHGIREYDRDLIDGFTGTNSTSEVKKLLQSIKKSGIKENGWVTLSKLKNGNVTAILGEGNHRINIAKQLKIKNIKIKFIYPDK